MKVFGEMVEPRIRDWNSSVDKALDLQSRSCEFNSWQEQRENFPLQGELSVLTLIWSPSHPHITKSPVILPKVQVASLHLNTHIRLTQESWSGLTVLSWHSVGT